LPATYLSDYLEASAARFPSRVAAVDQDGAGITYQELNERSSQVARFLASRGIRKGDRVGLLLPKNTAALTALFGILKAGAAYVPVEWTGPGQRIRTIFEDCAVRAIFADSRRAELAVGGETVVVLDADSIPGSQAALDSIPGAFTWQDVLSCAPVEIEETERRPDDLAYILYTSGSTGIPKGVSLTHRNAMSFVDWCSEVFTPDESDRFSSHAPFHFDLSVLDIFVSLKHSAELHLIPDELGKSPKDLARLISNRRITIWYSTPAILGLLGEFGDLDRLDCSSLRLVLFAGEVFPVKQLRRIAGCWPHAEYFNLYGPTETNVCTFARIPKPVPENRTEPYPIGFPCSHCEANVLDEQGSPVDPGSEGLLYIAGPAVFSGYWGRPSESSTAFVESHGCRWYNTGDVVKEHPAEGFIYVGRRDRMIKRRGYRIELGEVESCLHAHPAVTAAAVVAAQHPETGTRITAYVVSSGGSRPSIVEMKTFCHSNLPAYMNPDVFIFLDDLPRTSTNKVNYQALQLAGVSQSA
jgi:amino acid adenylation domain-containing protein